MFEPVQKCEKNDIAKQNVYQLLCRVVRSSIFVTISTYTNWTKNPGNSVATPLKPVILV